MAWTITVTFRGKRDLLFNVGRSDTAEAAAAQAAPALDAVVEVSDAELVALLSVYGWGEDAADLVVATRGASREP